MTAGEWQPIARRRPPPGAGDGRRGGDRQYAGANAPAPAGRRARPRTAMSRRLLELLLLAALAAALSPIPAGANVPGRSNTVFQNVTRCGSLPTSGGAPARR